MSVGIDGQTAAFAADFLGKRIDEVALAELEEIDWRPLLSALELRKPFREFRFIRRTATGGLRHLAVSGVPMFDARASLEAIAAPGATSPRRRWPRSAPPSRSRG